jgi:hypothetical protein
VLKMPTIFVSEYYPLRLWLVFREDDAPIQNPQQDQKPRYCFARVKWRREQPGAACAARARRMVHVFLATSLHRAGVA